MGNEALLLAVQLHVQYLSNVSCKTDTLTTLFESLQQYSEECSKDMREKRILIAYLSKSLLELYTYGTNLSSINKSNTSLLTYSNHRYKLLRTYHFNRYLFLIV
jgi:hypothetical protein